MASSHSSGERYFPARLKLSSGMRVSGTAKSHKLLGEAPLLLSHKHQGQLGIVLDTRDGAAWFKDHPHELLHVRRVAGSGLLAVCISDFANLSEGQGPMTFNRFYRDTGITSPVDLPSSPDGEGHIHCAYLGREFIRQLSKVITFGLDSFEKGSQSHALADLPKKNHGGQPETFDLEDHDTLRRAFHSVDPWSAATQFMDCRIFAAPGPASGLRYMPHRLPSFEFGTAR